LLELAGFWFDFGDDEAHQDRASVEIHHLREAESAADTAAATALTFFVSEKTTPVNDQAIAT
jgi:hypothetical protein